MKIRMRISPDGKTFKHLYNDDLQHTVDKALGKVEVVRASDVYYNNEIGKWKIKINGDDLKGEFAARSTALAFEHAWLEEYHLRADNI